MKHLLPFFNKKDTLNENIEIINEHLENIFTDPVVLQKVCNIVCKDMFDSPTELVAKRLKGGGSGDIIEVPGKNEMIKITLDRAEAYNAQYLINLGNKVTRFAKYFSVKRVEFEDPNDDKAGEIYSLKMEILNPVEGENQKICEKLIGWFNCKDMTGEPINKFYNFNNYSNYDDFLNNIKITQRNEGNTEEELKKSFGKENNYESIRQFYLAFIDLMKESIENKIVISDADSGNFAFNSAKKLVLFDLGANKSMRKFAISDKNVKTQITELKIPALTEQPVQA